MFKQLLTTLTLCAALAHGQVSWRQITNKPTTSSITEGSNLYFTNSRAIAAMSGLYSPPMPSTTLLLKGNGSGGASTATAADIATLLTFTPGNITNTGVAIVNAVPRYSATDGMSVVPSSVLINSGGDVSTPGSLSTGVGTSAAGRWRGYIPAGTFYAAIQAPATLSANYTLVLPTTSPSSGQVLTAGTPDGSGVSQMTWGTGGGGGSTAGTYSGTLDFGNICDGCTAALTFTATGISSSANLAVGLPASLDTGVTGIAFVSASNTVTVRLTNTSGATVNPASATYSVRDLTAIGYLPYSATINFGAIADGGCGSSTLTATGAVTGDNVVPGWPSTLETGLSGSMYVVSSDTIAVRVCNWSGATVDPASQTFRATITR